MTICAVIMAGGSGTRLWPLSRADHPKQFLDLYNNSTDTMLQSTLKRLDKLSINSSIIICNEDHRFLVAEQLRKINVMSSIILEPSGKNTAPALALASLSFKNNEDPLLLVLAADHFIEDNITFTKAVNDALPLALSGKLVTFGIVANEPNTGYGYIKKGMSEDKGYVVEKFFEKPSLEQAKTFIKSGNFFWNSGIFLFKASSYLKELKKYRPDIHSACQSAMMHTSIDNDFVRVNTSEFEKSPSDSIDYAVMEKTKEAVVIPMDTNWSDLGSWSSLWKLSQKDTHNNVLHGNTFLHETKSSFIKSDDKLIATIGIENLVIISTKDALLVANKDKVNDIKIITDELKKQKRLEWKTHREVYRPWGKYDSIDRDKGYQVKKLTVNPKSKLSVQLHYHRSEHWVVVSGQARVHYGNKSIDLKVNESTYHDKETIHSLENIGETPLELIEVQVGDYLEEDDIVRFEDNYGRVLK